MAGGSESKRTLQLECAWLRTGFRDDEPRNEEDIAIRDRPLEPFSELLDNGGDGLRGRLVSLRKKVHILAIDGTDLETQAMSWYCETPADRGEPLQIAKFLRKRPGETLCTMNLCGRHPTKKEKPKKTSCIDQAIATTILRDTLQSTDYHTTSGNGSEQCPKHLGNRLRMRTNTESASSFNFACVLGHHK